jgi:hypothetical protein
MPNSSSATSSNCASLRARLGRLIRDIGRKIADQP